MSRPWSIQSIPPQRGRLAVITGATGGIGFEAALALADAGADVVLTGRDDAKGDAALERIRALHPQATIRYAHLDLASLASVSAFADRFAQEHDALDLLINNGGVMVPPKRFTTADGFELQFGTNYLGHFALTHHLLPLLRKGRKPRVVNVSSLAHRQMAAIHFDDLQWQRRYHPWQAYAQSKLALLMFGLTLQRRSDALGWGLMSNTCHPGYARTGLQTSGPNLGKDKPQKFGSLLEPVLSQSAAEGAWPTLLAATSPDARGATYYGPQGLFGLKGPPGVSSIGKRARDQTVAERLWEVSEQLTGVRWPAAREAA
ncbi:SDR family oxidoreductase [Dyella caseinilytica]|uniref:SDR family oxidoreductase n=1 Tax=Dyella caseinilytica TaxID=1849581 RepID=A0ABX7GT88_9GAMM|nr:SDR family oxidoreductase [Dyella caseinilytica]QRN53665.1 SDR family oxidoreductase [Dyella caseinilytica]GFZ88324.1 dehydrogenase [Dyella caseinilytica]